MVKRSDKSLQPAGPPSASQTPLHIMKYITFRWFGFFVLLLLLTPGLSGCMTASTAMISGVTRADPVLKRDTYRQIKICEWGCAGTRYGQGAIKYENPKIQDI